MKAIACFARRLCPKRVVRGSLLGAALLCLAPPAPATRVKLTGQYAVSLDSTRALTPGGRLPATGRLAFISARFFRVGAFGGGGVRNVDTKASSFLSVELHRKPFLGAQTGQVLYTAGYFGLLAGASHPPVAQTGLIKSPNKDGFASVVLYEAVVDSSTGALTWEPRSSKDLGFGRF